MQQLVSVLKALSDESRLRILNLILEAGELCVCDIEHSLNFTQTKVSRHLTYLKHAGLVADKREGVWIFYSIPQQALQQYSHLFKELRAEFDGNLLFSHDTERLKESIKKESCTVSVTKNSKQNSSKSSRTR